jgi:hypothetical protein
MPVWAITHRRYHHAEFRNLDTITSVGLMQSFQRYKLVRTCILANTFVKSNDNRDKLL